MNLTPARATSPSADCSGGQYRRRSRSNDHDFSEVPASIYRYAAPSAPWPPADFHEDKYNVHPTPSPELPCHSEWSRYLRGLPEKWAHGEVNRNQMSAHCGDNQLSTVYKVSVFDDGSFDKQVEARTVRKDDEVDLRTYWHHLGISPSSNVRVQALFVEDMSLPVLQMLGTRYNIDPFFFASSMNGISSRYHEDPKALEDHVTIILPFIYTEKNQRPVVRSETARVPAESRSWWLKESSPRAEEKQTIDVQAPLSLPRDKTLFQDLLSLHMVRSTTTSTIISCHPSLQLQGTSAKRLQSLVQRTGDGIYWSKLFKRSKDPTFLILAILWYAVYAWDEALEVVFCHINAFEYDIIGSSDIKLAQELHKLQAHILYYDELLQDFLRSVEFVRDTPNPAMNAPSISEAEREDSARLLHREADALMSEIKRLTQKREMLSTRLDGIIHLTFAMINLEDSKAKQGLAKATATTLKQITYLSMIYLPATYLANIFSMTVREIDPSAAGRYIVTVVSFILFSLCIVIALRRDKVFYPRNSGLLRRMLWPWFYARGFISTKFKWTLEPVDRPDVHPSYIFEDHA